MSYPVWFVRGPLLVRYHADVYAPDYQASGQQARVGSMLDG